ncbi:MAG: preprotein translocase subunit SecY [Oscillospiraceae bacterium]|nr:preprotein translocase subunit SecY [Oscillospiraceae bacterium]MBQ8377517.1 preprotein translocase subunit SecY [Oscillospiraceae bacterium]
MFETFRNAWKVQDLRRKLLFTLFIIIVFRIGGAIPVPFLDSEAIKSWFNSEASGTVFGYMNMLSGDNFSKGTLLALSIGPIINAQIIIQLLTYALPPLERLSKEGGEGRKKLNKITKYAALAIAVFQAWAYYLTLKKAGAVRYTEGFDKVFSEIVIIFCFAAGASLVVWLGDQINESGIGNGISMILFAGIIARVPSEIIGLIGGAIDKGTVGAFVLVGFIGILFLAMIAFIIYMNNAERRIPIQYAKRVVGNKMYGGQSSYIPIKIAMSGVLPIIFASAFVSLPSTLRMFITPNPASDNFFMKAYIKLLEWFSYTHPVYAIIYLLLIVGFNYFYVSMQYNPIEIANNLRQNNGGIPGIRPGKPTSDFISKILSKLTLFGAFFLGIIAIIPIFLAKFTGLNLALGGTSILIVVSVALETVRALESQMMMRHHKGFLE